ncbi:MAG: hypothetical protein VX589_19880 [Myxococcota bacterium]|nr:hypothetical protein [Myxococcota bacterium]
MMHALRFSSKERRWSAIVFHLGGAIAIGSVLLGILACDDGDPSTVADLGDDMACCVDSGPVVGRQETTSASAATDRIANDAIADRPERMVASPVIDLGPSQDDAGRAEPVIDTYGMDAGTHCDVRLCDVGEICWTRTDSCVPRSFGRVGGPCLIDVDCRQGVCRPSPSGEMDGGWGICWQPCVSETDCEDGVCTGYQFGRGCLDMCDGRRGCGPDYVCAEVPSGEDMRACYPDCRRHGCGGQTACDLETGVCTQADIPCPFDCEAGASCIVGRCRRIDGGCVTDYHCAPGRTCFGGRCVMDVGWRCDDDSDCDVGHRCTDDEERGGDCASVCEVSADCPLGQFCQDEIGLCTVRPCTQDGEPTEPFALCEIGDRARGGTCLPVGRYREMAVTACIEAGEVLSGDVCDVQRLGRGPGARAVQCAAGLICFGDPDGLSPVPDAGGRGRCTALCSHDQTNCAAGTACIDFDDPSAAEPELTTHVPPRLCLPSDCALFESCGEGQVCQPYNFWRRDGLCRPQGQGGPGDPCMSDGDCLGVSKCVSRPGGTECLALCDDDVAPCVQSGARCVVSEDWAFGVCI